MSKEKPARKPYPSDLTDDQWRGVSSNRAENWEKAFSLLDSFGAHVYVRVYGNS
jgi:hypothetical protein